MYGPFFPIVVFGWCYVLILLSLVGLAAYRDLRDAIIPKWLTLPLLVSGVLANMIRTGWLAQDGGRLWLLDTDNWILGSLDGLLFSLSGFLVGFGLLFLFWILGTCGGGDVKLFSGLGTWTGPIHIIFVLVGSMFVATVIVVGKFVTGGLTPAQMRKDVDRGRRHRAGAKVSLPRSRLTYSLPVAVATLVVMLWFLRFELRLAHHPGIAADVGKSEGRIHSGQIS